MFVLVQQPHRNPSNRQLKQPTSPVCRKLFAIVWKILPENSKEYNRNYNRADGSNNRGSALLRSTGVFNGRVGESHIQQEPDQTSRPLKTRVRNDEGEVKLIRDVDEPEFCVVRRKAKGLDTI